MSHSIFISEAIDAHSGCVDTALLRAGLISAGMVAALLMNAVVFPRHCRVSCGLCYLRDHDVYLNLCQVYFLSDTSRTVGLLTDLYLTLSQCVDHDLCHLHRQTYAFTRRLATSGARRTPSRAMTVRKR